MASFRVLPLLVFLSPLLVAANCRNKPDEEVVDRIDTVIQAPEVQLQVISVDPSSGPVSESFPIQIYGSKFTSGARVAIGERAGSSVEVESENRISATVPALDAGVYDVTVNNPDGSRATLRRALTIGAGDLDLSICRSSTFYFDFDSAALTSSETRHLNDLVDCLKASSGSIRLEGHTDARGTTEYNIALGQRRAESVQRHVVNQGVAPSRVRAVSYGEERPAVSGSGESVWAKNRRVELRVEN